VTQPTITKFDELFGQDSYDIRELLRLAQENTCWAEPLMGPAIPVMEHEITERLYFVRGRPDEKDWVAIVKLQRHQAVQNENGKWLPYEETLYAVLQGGCDYSGWDCQAGGRVRVGHFLDDVINYGMSEEERKQYKAYVRENM